MSVEKMEPILSLPAAAALATKTFVSQNSSGQWAQTAAGARPDGLLQRAASGALDQVRAIILGSGAQPKAMCGGSFAINANLAVGANGTLVAATTGAVIIGKALEAGVAGQFAQFIDSGYCGVSA